MQICWVTYIGLSIFFLSIDIFMYGINFNSSDFVDALGIFAIIGIALLFTQYAIFSSYNPLATFDGTLSPKDT